MKGIPFFILKKKKKKSHLHVKVSSVANILSKFSFFKIRVLKKLKKRLIHTCMLPNYLPEKKKFTQKPLYDKLIDISGFFIQCFAFI